MPTSLIADRLRDVLSRYQLPMRVDELETLRNRGGFSGAQLWRWSNPAGSLLLRLWPAGFDSRRLVEIHRVMMEARRRGLCFIPVVFPARDCNTFVMRDERLWEIQEWLPGNADYLENPSREKLESACHALAQLHEVWSRWREPSPRACPAIQRRLDFVQAWFARRKEGWQPISGDPALKATLSAATFLVEPMLNQLPISLKPWTDRPFAVQPCHCDPWSAHFLFQEEHVSGLIDFGSVKVDNVAVDLARMLGSLIGDNEGSWQIGFRAYRSIRALPSDEEELARVLDRSGTMIAAATWIVRLSENKLDFDHLPQAFARLQAILQRISRFTA